MKVEEKVQEEVKCKGEEHRMQLVERGCGGWRQERVGPRWRFSQQAGGCGLQWTLEGPQGQKESVKCSFSVKCMWRVCEDAIQEENPFPRRSFKKSESSRWDPGATLAIESDNKGN